MFIHEHKLLWQKFVGGSFEIVLGTGCIGCVLIILASDVASNEKFADNVVGRRFAIEFAA